MGEFSISTTSTNDITGKVTWSESNVNIANNTSDLTVNLIYKMNASQYATYGSGYFKVTVNGTAYEDNHYVTFASGTHEYTVLTHTFTITHDANGAKSVSIVVNNGYVSGSTGLSASSGSGTATLTTIARASQPSAPNGTFGSAITISTNRASSSFTHTIIVTLGSSYSQTISSVGASTSFTIPASWAGGIPSATSATLGITCTTYNGSTNIGTKTTTFTATIPDSWKPSVSISKSISNAGSDSKVLVNVSTVNLTASATASTGTSISSYTWSGGTVSGTGASKSHAPTSAGTYTYTVTATDARGRTGTATVTATAESAISSISACASSVNFGSALTVSIARKKSTFTHVVRYRINTTYTADVNDNNTASTTYTIPTSWAASVPSSTSINMTVTVFTYNGSTNLGSVSKTVAVNVPSTMTPTVSSLTATLVDGFNSLYLKGISKVKLTASATAGTGSSISSYTFTGNNINASGTATNQTSNVLTTVGSNTFTVTVADARGRTATKTVTITVTDYKAPTLKLTVGRYDSDHTSDSFGEYGDIAATGTWSAVNGNKWTLVLKYKKRLASSYTTASTWTDQTGTISNSSGLFSADIDSAYDCQGVLTDAVGKSVTVNVALSTGKALLDLYKDSVASFFSTASENIRQEMNSPSTLLFCDAEKVVLNGKSYVPHTVEGGYDGRVVGWFPLNTISGADILGYSLDDGSAPNEIVSGDNFNNFTIAGTYYIRGNNTAASVTNCPVQYAGILKVIYSNGAITRDTSNMYIRQEYTPFNYASSLDLNTIYIRYGSKESAQSTVAWGEWRNVYSDLSGYIRNNNLVIGKDTDTSARYIYAINNAKSIRMYVDAGGQAGLFDVTNNNSIVYRRNTDTNQTRVPGVLYSNSDYEVWNTNTALNTVLGSISNKSVPTATVTELVTVTPGKAGIYLMLLDVNWDTASSATDILYVAVLNSSNSVIVERYVRSPQSGGGGASISFMYTLSATDKIRFRCYQASGAASTARYSYKVINLRKA